MARWTHLGFLWILRQFHVPPPVRLWLQEAPQEAAQLAVEALCLAVAGDPNGAAAHRAPHVTGHQGEQGAEARREPQVVVRPPHKLAAALRQRWATERRGAVGGARQRTNQNLLFVCKTSHGLACSRSQPQDITGGPFPSSSTPATVLARCSSEHMRSMISASCKSREALAGTGAAMTATVGAAPVPASASTSESNVGGRGAATVS